MVQKSCNVSNPPKMVGTLPLFGGCNPSEKYAPSKWVHLPQYFRVKMKNIFELPPPSGSPYQVVFAGWLNHQRGMSTYGLKGPTAATRGLFFSVRQTWPWRPRSFYWGSTNSASGTMYIVKPIYKKTTIDSRFYISYGLFYVYAYETVPSFPLCGPSFRIGMTLESWMLDSKNLENANVVIFLFSCFNSGFCFKACF